MTAKPFSLVTLCFQLAAYLIVLGCGAIYGVGMYQFFSSSIRPVNGLMLVSFLGGVPLGIGVLVGFMASRRHLAGLGGAGALSALAIALFVFTAGAVMREGAMCIAMAAPIFFVLGVVGALLGALFSGIKRAGRTLVPAALFLPILGAPTEAQLSSATEHQVVTRTVHIAAAPATIWQHINYPLDIKPMELGQGLAYRMGVPFPIEARTIEGRVGGSRMLKWERGVEFEETITAWEPDRHIAWVYRFGPNSFPPGSLDDHIVIGGRYFDLEATSYTLQPEGDGTRLTIVVRTRVTTNFNWYAGWWANYLVGDTADAILKFYKVRAETT